VLRLHTSTYPATTSITLEIRGEACRGEILTDGRCVPLDRVGCVWLRRPGPPTVDQRVESSAVDFVVAQAKSFLDFLYTLLGDVWVGHPHRLRLAEVKPLQLLRAHSFGLQTPDTLITNDRSSLAAFCRRVPATRYAVKPIHLLGVNTAEGWRFPLTAAVQHVDTLPGVEFAPTILQPYIPKDFELRCVVIGNEIFAARIDSQTQADTTIDWRGGDARHEHYCLPGDVARASLKLVKSFGLNFASMDLVVTPDGDHVFLELNPNGQFMWLEYELGLPLSGKMADLLCSLFTCTEENVP
jgi:glutathione synthase/RimK-type ligase-like ATP-grasp enzyme